MATHSSILAWEVSWREEPGCYSPWAHKELDTTEHACKKKSVQFSSVQSLGHDDPLRTNGLSMPGLPVHHQLPELTQTHAHWLRDAIQPSHPLLSPSPPAFNLCQHQGIFQWISSSHQMAKELELQNHYQSFHEYSGLISFRIDWLDLLAVQGTLKSLFQHNVQKHQYFGAQLSL